MKLGVALVSALMLSSASGGQACDLIKDPRPSWEQMIGEADVVFVGEAIEILPENMAGWGERVVFQVDIPVKGDIGERFEAVQGMNTCSAEFGIGARVIFAGRSLSTESGAHLTVADDTGWDPTVFLSNPPTPTQIAQMEYLSQITEDRYEGSK